MWCCNDSRIIIYKEKDWDGEGEGEGEGERERDFERLRFSLLLPREYIYENDTSTKPLSFSNSALLFSIVNTAKNSINVVAGYTQN